MAGHRLLRVEQQVTQIISELIMKGEIKDHRVSSLLSITAVELSRDLAYAKIRVSGFVEERELKAAVEGLNSAAGFIQSKLGKRMRTRNTPKLTFIVDTGISEGVEMTQRLRDLTSEDHETGSSADQ